MIPHISSITLFLLMLRYAPREILVATLVHLFATPVNLLATLVNLFDTVVNLLAMLLNRLPTRYALPHKIRSHPLKLPRHSLNRLSNLQSFHIE